MYADERGSDLIEKINDLKDRIKSQEKTIVSAQSENKVLHDKIKSHEDTI